MKSLFLSLLIVSTSLFAGFQITDVHITPSKTEITLENGMIWGYEGNDLFVEKGWMIGDRVNIWATFLSGYFLNNTSFRGTLNAKLLNASSEDIVAPKIVSIHPDEKDGSTTYLITLDDTSLWYVGSWSGGWMEHWKVGDRIVSNTQKFMFGHAKFLLMNLDDCEDEIPNFVRAQYLNFSILPIEPDPNQREGNLYLPTITQIIEQDPTYVELSNGMLCAMEDTPSELKVGDCVKIYRTKDELKLSSSSSSTLIERNLLAIDLQGVEPLYITSIDSSQKKITLSDNSLWQLNKRAKYWRVGDSVDVFSHAAVLDYATYSLWNRAHPNGQSAMLIR